MCCNVILLTTFKSNDKDDITMYHWKAMTMSFLKNLRKAKKTFFFILQKGHFKCGNRFLEHYKTFQPIGPLKLETFFILNFRSLH